MDQVELGRELVSVDVVLGAAPVKVHLQQSIGAVLRGHHEREAVIQWS